MARIWPQPQCSTGCCICYSKYRSWGCDFFTGTFLESQEYTSFVFDGTNTGVPVTSDTMCDQSCRDIIMPHDSYFSGPGWFACSDRLSTSIEYLTHSFQHGQLCCNVPYDDFLAKKAGGEGCFYQECCHPSHPPRGATAEDYNACNSEYTAAKCNPGFCLPETNSDPIECINLTTPCGNAILGSHIVSGTPSWCTSISDDRCASDGVGCCLCDRCCDMDPSACASKGGTVMSGSCSVPATQTTCRNANVKSKCKGGIWNLGIRPTQHTAKPGVMSIVSAITHKTKDLPSGQNECRKVYGWLQRSTTKSVMEGRICNQPNARCVSTKKSPIMQLVRHATSGVMQWEAKYRTPCPEQNDFLSTCSTLVGCAA